MNRRVAPAINRGGSQALQSKSIHEMRFDEVPDELRNVIGPRKLEILSDQFTLFDADNNGHINVEELGLLLALTGENPILSQLHEMLEDCDIDGDGQLSFGEFVSLWHKFVQETEGEEVLVQKAFEFFDRDGNGHVDLQEFQEVVTELGDALTVEECQLFFSHADTDNDGVLQYSEFLEFLKKDATAHRLGNMSLRDLKKDLSPRREVPAVPKPPVGEPPRPDAVSPRPRPREEARPGARVSTVGELPLMKPKQGHGLVRTISGGLSSKSLRGIQNPEGLPLNTYSRQNSRQGSPVGSGAVTPDMMAALPPPNNRLKLPPAAVGGLVALPTGDLSPRGFAEDLSSRLSEGLSVQSLTSRDRMSAGTSPRVTPLGVAPGARTSTSNEPATGRSLAALPNPYASSRPEAATSPTRGGRASAPTESSAAPAGRGRAAGSTDGAGRSLRGMANPYSFSRPGAGTTEASPAASPTGVGRASASAEPSAGWSLRGMFSSFPTRQAAASAETSVTPRD